MWYNVPVVRSVSKRILSGHCLGSIMIWVCFKRARCDALGSRSIRLYARESSFLMLKCVAPGRSQLKRARCDALGSRSIRLYARESSFLMLKCVAPGRSQLKRARCDALGSRSIRLYARESSFLMLKCVAPGRSQVTPFYSMRACSSAPCCAATHAPPKPIRWSKRRDAGSWQPVPRWVS